MFGASRRRVAVCEQNATRGGAVSRSVALRRICPETAFGDFVMHLPIPSQTLRHARHVPALLAGALGFLVARPASAQTLDATFTPAFDDTARAVAVEADGRILVGGDFSNVSGQSRPGIVRLAANGAVEAMFPVPSNHVYAIAVQADGRIVIGGKFDSIGGTARNRVARLLADGSLDPTFTSPLPDYAGIGVTDVIVQANGKIVIAGGFSDVSGQPRDGLARLNANGSLDDSFTPADFDGIIDAVMVQPDGRVVVAGNLHALGGACETGYCIARLTSNGAEDASFTAVDVIGSVNQLVRQDNGRILVAGSFGGLDDFNTYFVGRVGENGGVDTSFSNTALRYSNIERIIPLSDGRVLIGGEIRWGTAGSTQDRIARLEASGARDLTFNEPVLDSMILATALQPDGALLVGGMFTHVAGQSRDRLARFVLDRPDPVFHNGFE